MPITPLPLRKLVTGAWISSASAATSCEACCAPAPTTISGLRASRISPAISAIRSGSGSGGGGTVLSTSRSTRAAFPKTSHGASIAAGRMRPPCIRRNASATARGASVAWSIRSAQPVKLRKVASWSGNSWSWPRPRPIRWDMMLPVTHSNGVLAPYATLSAEAELSTPGPGTTV